MKQRLAPSHSRPFTTSMRWLLFIGSLLAFIAGVQLFVLSEETDRYFAWTIDLPLTAAFLGAIYWAGAVLVFLGWRQPTWIRARVAIPGVLLFATFTLLTTLIHLDLFHFQSTDLVTVTATWAWLAVYILLPVVGSLILFKQLTTPGRDSARDARIPFWVSFLLALQAAVMLILGIALFLYPTTTAPFWPWDLTPLTARAVGSWLLGLGLTAAQAVGENDWKRIWIGMASYCVLAVLQFVALVRFASNVNWNNPPAWFYLLFLVSVLLVSVYGLIKSLATFQKRQTTHGNISPGIR